MMWTVKWETAKERPLVVSESDACTMCLLTARQQRTNFNHILVSSITASFVSVERTSGQCLIHVASANTIQ